MPDQTRRVKRPLSDDQQRLVTRHLAGVTDYGLHLARKGRYPSDRDDCVQDARMALVIAATAWTATTGVPFERYLWPKIRWAVIDGVRYRHGRLGSRRLAAIMIDIQEPTVRASDVTVEETLPDPHDDYQALLDRWDEAEAVVELGLLTNDRERTAITMRCWHGASWREIGEALGGVTESRALQISKAGLARIRCRLQRSAAPLSP